MVCSRPSLPSWMSAAALRVDSSGSVSSLSNERLVEGSEVSSLLHHHSNNLSDFNLGFGERAFSAAGAVFLSAIHVNPLDVAKTRLQAQAAQSPYSHFWDHVCSRMASLGPKEMFSDLRCSPSCTRAGILGALAVCPDCFQYKGTFDVFYKIIQQEGLARL